MNRHELESLSSAPSPYRTIVRRGAIGLTAVGVLALLAPACLDRPVAPQQPSTSKLSTRLYRTNAVDKIDLLFMIDNSASMADKQALLAYAVPDLVGRLVNPICVNIETGEAAPVQPANASDNCVNVTTEEREFTPIKDIHIGVITSSIGGHAADSCSPQAGPSYNERQEDMSRLIQRGKAAGEAGFHPVATYADKGFLNWDTRDANDPQKFPPAGDSDPGVLVTKFTEIVRGAGEDGCGFEANLEAWYRFLVDPAPYEKMVRGPCNDADTANSCAVRQGIDQVVLTQRADFLRKDSLVAVIMLTDENDCSIMDGGQNYLVLQQLQGTNPFRMAAGTPECLDDPWSDKCKSCWAGDANCANSTVDDALNLRCWEQKRRFGINFLQPISRYVNGLTKARPTQDPKLTEEDIFAPLNPVFCSKIIEGEQDGRKTYKCDEVLRDSSLVFLGAITGVPWQDIANDPTDLSKGYRPVEQFSWTRSQFEAAEMTPPPWSDDETTLWNVILGETQDDVSAANYMDIKPTVAPKDPLMAESLVPRSGTNPATGAALADVSTPPGTAGANPINGFEWEVTSKDDLQYACIFDLPEPIDCSPGNATIGCDCDKGQSKPLCYDTSSNSFGYTQFRAKAYPGRRQLAVLKGVGEQSIVASICPANVRDDDPGQPGLQIPSDRDWGYRPAIAAIVDRLKSALQGTCWDQELQPDANGQVPCVVLEATKATERDENDLPICPPCDEPRLEPTSTQQSALAGDPTFISNGLDCVCQIPQVTGGGLEACVREQQPQNVDGWCYVDPTKDPAANPSILAACPENQKRLIRFVGDDIPTTGSLTFLQCRAGSLGSAPGVEGPAEDAGVTE